MTKLSLVNIRGAVLAVPALLGVGVLLVATVHGPAIAGDATVYIFSAKNLVEGIGLGIPGPDGNFRYLSHYPPLFPLVLAAVGYIAGDFIEAARLLNALLFGMIILMFGVTFFKATRSYPFSLLSQLVLLVSPILIYQFIWAMSEPLSVFLGFKAIFLLLVSFSWPKYILWLPSSLLAGLAGLTRLIGITFIFAGGFLILLYGQGNGVKRLKKSLAYMGVGGIPTLGWYFFDYLRTDSLASRQLGTADFLEAPAAHLAFIFNSLTSVSQSWLIPVAWVTAPPYPGVINWLILIVSAAIFGLSVGIALWMKRRHNPAEWMKDPVVMLLVSLLVFIGVYFLMTVFLYVTVLPRIDLNSRMLLPVHGAVLGVFLLSGFVIARSNKIWRWLPMAVYSVFIGIIAIYGFRSLRIVVDLYDDGIGYTGKIWQSSETIKAVMDLPTSTAMISNEEAAVLFFTGKAVYPIMEFYELYPQTHMTSFGESEEDEIQRLFREEGAALILFDTVLDQLAGLYGDRALIRAEILTQDLFPYFTGSDGAIFFYKDPEAIHYD
jgi:hypothetical protein